MSGLDLGAAALAAIGAAEAWLADPTEERGHASRDAGELAHKHANMAWTAQECQVLAVRAAADAALAAGGVAPGLSTAYAMCQAAFAAGYHAAVWPERINTAARLAEEALQRADLAQLAGGAS